MSRYFISVVERTDPRGLRDARMLFEAYGAWLGPLVGTTTLPGEIATLPSPYEAPTGVLLLARDEAGAAVGIVGIRQQDVDACEIKRLFVREEARGHGLGRALARAALDHARVLGYKQCYLTSLPGSMPGALRMYRSLGFSDTDAFRDFGHVPDGVGLVFMKRPL